MRSSRAHVRALIIVILGVVSPTLAFAGMQSRIDDTVLLRLAGPLDTGKHITLPGVPLGSRTVNLNLERFEVWAPGAVIEMMGANGRLERVSPPAVRYFRGTIAGEPDSLVMLALGKRVEGIIISNDRRFRVYSQARSKQRVRRDDDQNDTFVEETSDLDETASGEPWQCDLDKFTITKATPLSAVTQSIRLTPASDTLSSPTATYVLNLAIITDNEFFGVQGSNATTFVGNLVAAASTIYHRDLQTDLRISYERVYGSAASDPDLFNVIPGSGGMTSANALAEFGDYWHNTPPTTAPKSAAVLLSGKSQRTGVAWINMICSGEFFCSGGNCGSSTFDNHYAGPYAFNGGVGLDGTSIPNPNAGVNYVAPSLNYWTLLQFTHELGHVVQSRHTHCVGLDPGEVTATGRSYVDVCYSGEPTCYTNGTTGPTGMVPPENGTIMSYCHLNGGGTSTRYTFGQVTEVSHHILDNMKGALLAATPNLSAISAPLSVTQGVTGNVASVTNVGGLTYSWTVVNGSITAGANTNVATFTGTSNPVTLVVTAMNVNGCSSSDFVNVTVSLPPGGKRGDVNGDGRGDVIWRHTSGANAFWYMNGVATPVGGFAPSLDSNWTLAGSGDFDGDGKTDLLWRHTSGLVAVWLMNGTTILNSAFLPSLDSSWTLAGIGDFDGDGKADILWRHTSGVNAIWFMNGVAAPVGAFTNSLDPSWSLRAVGDFDGDHKADLLWRHSSGLNAVWIMSGTTVTSSAFLPSLDSNWSVAATGDFNADGRTDLLWRHSTGINAIWFMNGIATPPGQFTTSLDPAWTLVAAGDFDGDGHADLLWRLTNGQTAAWLMNGASITNSGYLPSLDSTWTARPKASTNGQ